MKDEQDPKEQAPAIEIKRREFLKTLGLVGGGLLAYSTPVVQASELGASAEATSTVRFFDVATPAQYSIREESVVLELIVDEQAVAVDFHAVGVIRLSKTTEPDVSRVQIVSLQFESNDPNPLGAVGRDDGRLSATVPADTDIGQLNHRTGTLAEHSFPITLASERGETITALVNPGRAVVSEGTGDRKCTKENDVDIPTDVLRVRGTILLGMEPSMTPGTTGTA